VRQLAQSSTFSGVFGTSNSGGYSGVLGIDIDAPDIRSIDMEDFLEVLEDYFDKYKFSVTPRIMNTDAFSIGNPVKVGKRSEEARRGIPDQVSATPVDIRQYFTNDVPGFPTYKASC
jgi:hypothetical protein